jgi:coenzyme PQQ biosynthesis protein PqqD
VIELGSRPRLAAKARLRFDERSGKHMLLYPERGLELTDTAARITKLCGEGRSVAAMVDEMTAAFPGEPRARVEAEVLTLLRALDDRGLLIEDAS